jgi:hypothetical protein
MMLYSLFYDQDAGDDGFMCVYHGTFSNSDAARSVARELMASDKEAMGKLSQRDVMLIATNSWAEFAFDGGTFTIIASTLDERLGSGAHLI